MRIGQSRRRASAALPRSRPDISGTLLLEETNRVAEIGRGNLWVTAPPKTRIPPSERPRFDCIVSSETGGPFLHVPCQRFSRFYFRVNSTSNSRSTIPPTPALDYFIVHSSSQKRQNFKFAPKHCVIDKRKIIFNSDSRGLRLYSANCRILEISSNAAL